MTEDVIKDTDTNATQTTQDRPFGNVMRWIIIFMAAIALEFFGRTLSEMIDWRAPAQFATSLSIIVGLAGYFVFMRGKKEESQSKQFTGKALLILAIVMVATSEMFKQIVPLIFG
jgi:cytochrome bd-type quinol oxidase subunit 2